MQADAQTREEVLLALGEFRAAVAQKRIEGVLTLMAPDADATVIGSSVGASVGDVAWLWLDGGLVLDGRSHRPYRITGVLERRQGRWIWSLFHGSEPR